MNERQRMSSKFRDRLGAAVSTTLVTLVYNELLDTGASTLTLACVVLYVCLQVAADHTLDSFMRPMLVRVQVVLVGVLGNVLLASLQIASVRLEGIEAGTVQLLVYDILTLSCILIFVGVSLEGVKGASNFVGVVLFVFSDAVQGVLESGQNGAIIPLVTVVVCITSPWLSATVDARVPGLSVLVRALFMASVNWLLDLVSDTSATPVTHCSMLLLLTVLIEVCKHVYAELDEPQAYAIYRIGAVLSAYLLELRVESGIVAALGLFYLIATHRYQTRWPLLNLAFQILLMLTVNAIVAEFRKSISVLPTPNKAFALISLIIAFEAAKLF
jgi:hypothetical protein